ncbi:Cell surface glycan-binding lipoprotein, utilization system for glycans and polysaccharides (PUL), SusD family [hydrothermal vent metagenome]|uniref:Cell surface glycan-binding lipoprotein, utilization system for glycans and polysaccharides (PUL), SusD family n=1 Tax=hydrothermal vent metagenome TaxID=652676 RepID=A0A3B0TJS8_9ZZZZ
MKNITKSITIAMTVIFIASCDTVYLDPNSTLEPDVVESTDNLIKLINGVQQRWSTDRSGIVYNYTHISGLNTGELRLLNPGNLAENEIILGGNDVNGGNGILNSMWTNTMLCRKEATTVINSSDGATEDAAISNSLKAYGLFYRALSHGTVIQVFESIPIEIIEDAQFVDRAGVLQNAIADLVEAKGYIDSGLSSSVTSGVFSSVDLGNSVNALLARFYLMNGDYNAAITAANAVDLSVKSTWAYTDAFPNPLAFLFGSQNVTQAKNTDFGLPANLLPDPNDSRITFYTNIPDAADPANVQLLGFWTSNLDEVPVYLPGEMLLIKAEAYARNNDLANAVTELDAVLTKMANADAFGVGAGLPAYSGAMDQNSILDEVYKNRRIELYLSGLGLEDTRRFERPSSTEAGAERNRDFYPYPNAERDNNTNTPTNPSS